jgi:type VI secretion system protein ImpM
MPALGDFFRLRADAGFVAAWDPWLQESMLAGRKILGPHWDECYLTAPIWRFCLPAGMAGPATVAGVLMPSIDRVGRQFPLTLVTELPAQAGRDPLRSLFEQEPMLDALELVALDALDDAMTRDDLDSRLAVILPVPGHPPGMLQQSPSGGITMMGGLPQLLAADIAATVLHAGRMGVWACTVDEEARVMTTPRLPAGPEALALFDLDAAFWAEPVA